MAKSYKVIRHPAVDQDLFDILDLIADYSGIDVALIKLGQIEETINSLTSTPHTGSVRDDIYPGLRAIPTARKGVISFFVDDATETIQIVSITYAGAEWARRVETRT